MSLPVSDDFNRANEDPITTGGTWQAMGGCGLPRLESNQLLGSLTTGTYPQGICSTETFDADHLVRWTGAASSTNAGGAVRASTGASLDCYFGTIRSSTVLRVLKVVGGTVTQLGADVSTSGVGTTTVIELKAEGTTLTISQDGSPLDTRSDSSHASGLAGVVMPTGSKGVDNFYADNLAAGGGSILPMMMHHGG